MNVLIHVVTHVSLTIQGECRVIARLTVNDVIPEPELVPDDTPTCEFLETQEVKNDETKGLWFATISQKELPTKSECLAYTAYKSF